MKNISAFKVKNAIPRNMRVITRSRVASRDDLSFTTRDDMGRMRNWVIHRAPNSIWNHGVNVGHRLADEIRDLAHRNPKEAISAILFALTAVEWNGRYGTEHGFAEAIAKAAIDGFLTRV